MSKAYNALLACANGLVKAAAAIPGGGGKTRRFIRGASGAVEALKAFVPAKENYWFHCSSLGEYAIARPLMEELKRRRPDCRIALTFFSSTGIDALARRSNLTPDFIGFLPPDTPQNAAALLEALRPTAALFMVSEYWPNYLFELRRRNVPTYLVSTIFSHKAPHFKPLIGSIFRRSLAAYSHIFVLNNRSLENLAELGFTRAGVCGDPLVDNALKVAETPWRSEPLEDFCSRSRTLIAGSIHDDRDIALLAHEINSHPERRYLLVPHEVDRAHISRIENALEVPVRRLSRYEPDMAERVMIVDNVGSLAYLYRLGTMAYIGGGFTSQLHSVLEAVVYGLPIAFGPRTERKVVPTELVGLGLAEITATPDAFSRWANRWFNAPRNLLETNRHDAMRFCHAQAGATASIIDKILCQNTVTSL